MDLTLLETLKQKLIHAKDFKEVMGYFLDHFAEDPEFLSLGESARHPTLEALIPEVIKETVMKDASITNLLLIRLPEHKFIHGGCLVDGKLANVLYFEDIHIGLVALVVSFTSGRMEFSRFSDRPVHGTKDPSLN